MATVKHARKRCATVIICDVQRYHIELGKDSIICLCALTRGFS